MAAMPRSQRRRPLVFWVEVLCLLAWVGLAVAFQVQQGSASQLVPLDVAALATGASEERWNGIFFQDQHVGYAVSHVTPTADGGTLYEERSQFRIAAFGKLQRVVVADAALVDKTGALRRFDFFQAADRVRIVARGEVLANEIRIEVDQGGETQTLSFPISKPPQVGISLEDTIRRTPLAVGVRFSVPFFNPVLMADGELKMKVTDVEVLANGEEAYWVESEFQGVQTRQLVLPSGAVLRQEGALGMSIVRMTREEAEKIDEDAEPVDLIALSAVRLKGRLKSPRGTRRITLRVSGVDPARIPNEAPLQRVEESNVTVDVPLWEELPVLPVRDDSEPSWLASTANLPAENPEMRDRAREVVGDATDRKTAAKRLVDWVFTNVEKVPTMGVPNGLDVLHTLRGDCNEHTALLVSLARAAGIPARIAAGVVYSDRITGEGAFYYHAWPELRLGGPTDWVPVDPTFGQTPADATHIKLVEGDLDRQVEIMGYLGKLGLEVVEAR